MLLKHTLRITSDFTRRQAMAMANASSEENVIIHTLGRRALSVDIFRPIYGPIPECKETFVLA